MSHKSEIDAQRVRRQVSSTWITDLLFSPFAIQLLLIAGLVAGFLFPVTLLPACLLLLLLLTLFSDEPFRLPLRMPVDMDMPDRSTEREMPKLRNGFGGLFRYVSRLRQFQKSAGIMCLGYARGKWLGRELWLTLDDTLRHMLLLATTGSGKTEALLSVFLNAICWGRGICYSDGKAQNSLHLAIWSLARRFGREDDAYTLNFMTGGIDKFEALLNNIKKRLPSNTINLFGTANTTFIIQLMEALMPAAGSGDAGWQDKAKSMLSALVYAVYYKCAREKRRISQAVILEYLPLRKMAELYVEAKRDGWHKEAWQPLESYLNTLAGFRIELVGRPSEWESGVFDQHGFLIQQFNRMLTMFNDIYGHVFAKDAGDVDIEDVLHNDRILTTLIPALELSKSEAANIGKLYISAIRMTIARDLGCELEGMINDVLIVKKYSSKYPYPIAMDELGAYFGEGMDNLASQLRSLQYMLIVSAQDIQRFIAQFRGEFMTVNANLLTKWFMALQDEKDTYELAALTAGKGYYSELGSLEQTAGVATPGYEDAKAHYIREKNRLDLADLKDLQPGEGMISFKSALVQSNAVYIPDDDKLTSALPARINRFIDVARPTEAMLFALQPELTGYLPPTAQETAGILQHLGEPAAASMTPGIADPVLRRVVAVALDLDNRADISYTPAQRGVLLFEAAREAMNKQRSNWKPQAQPPKPVRVSKEKAAELAAEETTSTTSSFSSYRQQGPRP
ncbi:type IV secretory system conjugative DNA transfer family protein [Enterobacteriaceae bacterium H11S18]|uniref:F-type conjugative transfer protein TrbC n=1 Tax=Dryocola clanedunensis TaxID=2925396 RepID=UPI0022F08B59|nr:F-type conjugative transfer protein TrbC [Dryocola clanedunensis]MCT4709246.1 type IV secretory system conjugative DNA transfer family protein [Dryocola clanedunensis]